MKEAYIYKDEQIIVADIKEDKCVEVKYGYQDNIEEVLKTENILEFLNIEKERISKELLDIDKKRTNTENLTPTIIASWIYYSLLSVGFGTIIGLFTNIWLIVWLLLLIISLICASSAIYNEINISILNKKQKGYKLELQKIHEQLNKNKTYLEKLKNDKRISLEKTNKVSKKFNYVEYKEKLEELKKYLETYKLIGKNIELYKKYYKKGILNERLNKILENDQIELIKKYIKKDK